jgi:endogenous inhibitor of DNA gyrase (YacG/DUF329 family)
MTGSTNEENAAYLGFCSDRCYEMYFDLQAPLSSFAKSKNICAFIT